MPDTEVAPAGRPLQSAVLEAQSRGHDWWVVPLTRLNEALPGMLRGRADAGATSPTDLTARDPRGVGVRGGYPQVNTGMPGVNLLQFVRIAYRRSAPARVLVDKFAGDAWSQWITLDAPDALKERIEAFFRNPTGRAGGKPLWWWFKRAERLSRRDGRSLLYFGLIDSTGDAGAKPAGVRGVAYLAIIREDDIQGCELHDDPDDPTSFGQVKAWRIQLRAGANGKIVPLTVHPDRVLPFIPDPKEDDEWGGESILAQNLNYVEGLENILWAVIEAYFQEASPYVIVMRDPLVTMNPEDEAKVKEAVAKMQQSLTQRIFLKGVKVEVLAGSGQLANPEPHWRIAKEVFSMASGIPQRELVGDARGEQSASQEDTRRWRGTLREIKENHCDPLLNVVLDRLIEWKIQGWASPPPRGVDFTWNAYNDADPNQEATRQLALAQARAIYADKRLKMPKDLEWEVTEDPELLQLVDRPGQPESIYEIVGAPPGQTAGGFGRVDEAALPPADQVKVESVRRVEAHVADLVARALNRFWAQWEPKLQDYIREASRVDEASDRPGVRLEAELAKGLKGAVLEAYEEAVRLGVQDAAAQANADQATLDAALRSIMEKRGVEHFRTVSRLVVGDTARRISQSLRQIVADGMRANLDPTILQQRLRVAWPDLAAHEASRIARTESMMAYNAGHEAAMQAIGADNFEYIAYPGSDYGDPDGPCNQRNGRIFPVGSEDDTPPLHPNCRCTMRPILPGAA